MISETRERVLNVDDDEAGRSAKSRDLEQAGYDVLEAGAGEALAMVEAQRPALVLLAVKLPDISGLEVCAEIKRRWPDVLVVQISASYSAGEERVRGLDAGADSVLAQPIAPQELVAVVRALLRLRGAESALRLSEERFRTLADAIPQLAWIAGPDAVPVWLNRRYIDFVGAGDAPSQGQRADRIPADQRQAVLDRFRAAVAEGSAWEDTFQMRRADGSDRWLLGRALPIHEGQAGGPTRWFGTFTDITDQRETEAELAELNEALERRVAERTAQLESEMAERQRAEEALRQAHKMEAIGQLTGGVAHDFNNLLTAITGNIELLQRRLAAGQTDVGRFADGAMASARRAAALTQRLLAFSRRQALEPRSIDLNQLVEGMEELIRRSVGEQVELRTELTPDLWRTWCDPNQTESALLNLVINARDAMPNGGLLTVETGNHRLEDGVALELEPGDYVRLSVRDTGTGMDAEALARAFDPFFTTKPIGQGTGLGLSQLYGFAKQSGGHAWIESELGRGATVHILLPRREGEATSQSPSSAEPLSRGHGETLLVVEDEPLVRLMVILTLQDAGYKVIETDEAKAALQVLGSGASIDLLITDVGLPGMNGRQLADLAREQRQDLSVLFMTGYAHAAPVGSDALAPGMALIAKPFQVDELVAAVKAMLGR